MFTLLGSVTLLACISKLIKYDSLNDALIATQIVPQAWVRFAAPGIVLIEMIGLFGLLFKMTRPAALLTLGLFYAGAAVYSALRLLRGITAECGCFPGVLRLSPGNSVVLTLLLFGACIYCYLESPGKEADQSSSKFDGLRSTLGIALGLIFTLAAAWKVLSFHPAYAVPGLVEMDEVQTSVLRTGFGSDAPEKHKVYLFMDMDCISCHQVREQLLRLQREIPSLVLETHHLPLTGIHPDSVSKAVMVEACQIAGYHSEVASMLGAEVLDNGDWKRIAEKVTQNAQYSRIWKKAQGRVGQDINIARALKLNATPSLFLSIGGHFFFVNDFSKISDLVRNFVKSNPS